MLRAAARRGLLLFGGVLVGTVVVSLLIGLAAGSSATRAVSSGLYVVGALFLVGCFIMGVRGPLRGEYGDSRRGGTGGTGGGGFLPTAVRKASPDERSDAAALSILLFVVALGMIALGAAFDPNHKLF